MVKVKRIFGPRLAVTAALPPIGPQSPANGAYVRETIWCAKLHCVSISSALACLMKRISKNEFRVRLKGDLCFYCGEAATTVEHFPPYTDTRRGFLFPCCRECNNLAGTHYPRNLVSRIEHVKKRIKQSNKKYLCLPEWSAKEIRALSGNLRRMVNLGLAKKLAAQERIDFDSLAYLARIDTDCALFALSEEGDFEKEEE